MKKCKYCDYVEPEEPFHEEKLVECAFCGALLCSKHRIYDDIFDGYFCSETTCFEEAIRVAREHQEQEKIQTIEYTMGLGIKFHR